MQHTKTNGIRLAYRSEGRGPALLFIHGLGSSTQDWPHQLEYFSRKYRCLALDLRGHGQSDKPPGPYSISMFAKDVADLLEDTGAQPVSVVGLSLGGMVGFQLAVDHPHLITKLVVVNSAPAVVPQTWRQKMQFKQREWIVRFLGMRRMGQVLADRLLPEPWQSDLHRTFVARWSGNDPRAYLASLRAIVGWSVYDQISAIRQPVLVISADQDYTTPEQKRAWLQRIPNARLQVVSNSRHMTPLDQPDAFNAVLEAFLTEQ